LLSALFSHFAPLAIDLHVLLVDDGSPIHLAEELRSAPPPQGGVIEVLRLRRNVGHQRAIALGISYVHDHIPCDALLVMDADGEDRPEDAVRLWQHLRSGSEAAIIFAERTRRSESRLFRVLYRAYQLMHWLLTGIRVRVGNFSLVPARYLPALTTLPATWNHYAAAVFHSRLPYIMIPTQRGKRLDGSSKMNYFSLVMHGFHALSVFCDIISLRLLLAVVTVGGGGVAMQVLLPGRVQFGWSSLFLLVLITLVCFLLVLNVLSHRNSLDFLPIRDYRYFIEYARPVAGPK
jgi:glycosyltransferase involved in cell wall biosynthesis